MAGGFAAALVGAFGGFGQGMADKAKADAAAMREEKLLALAQANQMAVIDKQQTFQAGQNAIQVGLQERGLGLQEKQLEATTKYQQDSLALQKELAESAQTHSEKMTKLQIKANKDMAKIAADNALILNAKPVYVNNPDDPAQPILKYMRPDGKEIALYTPDGKLTTLADTVDDTDAMKNMKALVRAGVPQAEAINRVLPMAKATNSWQESKQTYFKAIEDSASTMKNLTEEDHIKNQEIAEEMADRDFPGERPGAPTAVPAEPAAATETTVPAETPPRPAGATDEVLIQQADAGVKAGTLSRQEAKKRLKDWQVDPQKAAAVGL